MPVRPERARRAREPQKGYRGCMEDDDIRALVTRLARVHPSGGTVVERAAVIAEGSSSEAVMSWILAHGGKPEETVVRSVERQGLHGARRDGGRSAAQAPSRFVLPAGALD
jgi:hypothetical protein